ncbi:MAG: hypothetical protein NC116_10385 [Clostridium sp.]|nr:hypothetical protein [Clostridium sp.]
MTTIFLFLYVSSFVTPVLAPFLYRSRRPSMIAFYRRMTFSFGFRRLYTLMLTLYLVAFHFYHLSIYRQPQWLLPSTVLVILMYSPRISERMFHFMQDRQTLPAFCLQGMFCLFFPQFLPLGFTVLVIAVAAVFFPSTHLRDSLLREDVRMDFLNGTPETVAGRYFRWSSLESVLSDGCTANFKTNSRLNRKCPDVIEDAEVIEYTD